MKKLFLISLCLACFLTACKSSAQPEVESDDAPESRNLIVFVAASLTDAFTEIGGNFEARYPGVTVTFNFGGSQMLRTQIEEGAPVDVFAPANEEEMDLLIRGGFVLETSPRIFLTNRLVLILPADNPAGIDSLEDLSVPGIKLVLAAEEVPVGRYSRQALEKMTASFGADFKDKVLANVVSNEDNVRQVVAKVQLGEADAGIVYVSDAVAVPELQIIEIPADLNVAATYPIAPLAESANIALAEKFVDYLLSNEGQATLRKWGFGPAP
ncbi:MAG: molybdate ABC transporter substrate-binding protein [Chloroflexi bacterium]|nr:molybdate ABC transporter substrate-binding protein [Chloroflexota bacterium]